MKYKVKDCPDKDGTGHGCRELKFAPFEPACWFENPLRGQP